MVTTLVVSGKTAERVASTAGVLADWMEGDGRRGGVGRCGPHRSITTGPGTRSSRTVCARDRAQAVAGLRALAAGPHGAGGGGPTSGAARAGHGVRVFGSGLAVGRDGPAVAGR